MKNETEITARMRSFLVILKYGHDLFDAETFSDAALLAVNNAFNLMNFKNSSLIEIIDGKAKVISQYGQVNVNPYSRLAVQQAKYCETLKLDSEPLIVTKESGLPKELAEENNVYCFLKLTPPKNLQKPYFTFVWLLEYEETFPNYLSNILRLLATSMSEALHYHKLCKKSRFHIHIRFKKFLFWLLVLASIVSIMFAYVPEGASAEFTLKAPEITSVYALFDGPIATCLKQDGEAVKKGDLIAQYNTSQLEYRLSIMQSAYIEIKTELELEEHNAFTDQSRLGRAKLLEAKLQTAKVNVEEAQWYLTHSNLYAPADGILALVDGRAEQLSGKAVRTGDKLYEIYGGKGMIAEIPVNEQDSSVIRDKIEITLFLHTAPEIPIPVKIIEIAEYPELTEQRTYCYKIRAQLPEEIIHGLRYGMRGIAKIKGEPVRLGYFLFKSVVLYFRRI
ncbi:MAG: efflux RND transporter periplasmic adaptor subunit [Planctomycetes bacterium]|jgi:hypothetical protein|nr:efflux RND transporter periplasmic adaptor subunit [Planctomycetota bacterium]HPY74730.1 efflux RND transporter periplasmic adaptor subunit [Planctomycetota bacterium]HQA99737.1 efflux RND transporter periplasmic adaptor subunit [Planctomycetota bacterium]